MDEKDKFCPNNMTKLNHVNPSNFLKGSQDRITFNYPNYTMLLEHNHNMWLAFI